MATASATVAGTPATVFQMTCAGNASTNSDGHPKVGLFLQLVGDKTLLLSVAVDANQTGTIPLAMPPQSLVDEVISPGYGAGWEGSVPTGSAMLIGEYGHVSSQSGGYAGSIRVTKNVANATDCDATFCHQGDVSLEIDLSGVTHGPSLPDLAGTISLTATTTPPGECDAKPVCDALQKACDGGDQASCLCATACTCHCKNDFGCEMDSRLMAADLGKSGCGYQ